MRNAGLSVMVILLAALMYVAPRTVSAHTAGVCTEAAQEYWTHFRKAARRSNAERVADLGSFPFKLKPTLDSSEATQIGRDEFIERFPELLKVDPGLNANPTTMRSMVEKHPRLSARFCNSKGNQFRVGAWLFQLTPEGWRFVQATVD